MAIVYEKVLARVLRDNPDLASDPEEASRVAYEWCADLAADYEQREDTDCIQDHMPAEYFTESGAAL